MEKKIDLQRIPQTQRDYIIITEEGRLLTFTDGQKVVYGSLEDAEDDFNVDMDECIFQQSIAVKGCITRTKYDYRTKTGVKFIPNDAEAMPQDTNDIYLPTEIAEANGIRFNEERNAVLAVKLLETPTETHLTPYDMDAKPRLEGWISRASRKAFHEPTNLCFSTFKPKPTDNGYFEYKGHCFSLNASEFPLIKEMNEPVPAVLEIRLEM